MAREIDQSIRVTIDEKGGVERSLKKFKRLCESFGVIREYRKRQEYKKPSVRMKEKTEAAEKRRRKTRTKRYEMEMTIKEERRSLTVHVLLQVRHRAVHFFPFFFGENSRISNSNSRANSAHLITAKRARLYQREIKKNEKNSHV